MNLSASGLVKRYGPYLALDDVSVQLNETEKVGVLGPNGSGKSTLLGVLAGLITPTAGTVTIDGTEVERNQRRLRRHLGYVAHETMLYDELTARENLEFHANLRQLPTERVDTVLELVDLAHRGHSSPTSFSHGMKKRLSFARAELDSPPTLLLDEPFSGLDQESQETVVDLLEDRSVLLVTHDFGQALELCDRILVLQQGSVVGRTETTTFEDEPDIREWYREVLRNS